MGAGLQNGPKGSVPELKHHMAADIARSAGDQDCHILGVPLALLIPRLYWFSPLLD